MGKSYRGNAKYDRWRKRDSKPRHGNKKQHQQDDHVQDWKPMGGSAQTYLIGDDSSFHD